MGEYKRQNLVYEKEDLLIRQQYHDYIYRVAGLAIKGRTRAKVRRK
jgi:hypothetical protein